MFTVTERTVRVLGRNVLIKEQKDGVQRHQLLSIDGNPIGYISSSRYVPATFASNAEKSNPTVMRAFVEKYGMTREQTYTDLRRRLVSLYNIARGE